MTYSISHTTRHIVHQSNNNMLANGMPTAFQFDMLPTALQNAIGQGGKLDVRSSGGEKHLLVRVMLPPSIFDWLLNPFFGFCVLLTRILSC
jgi:hypothetical protein